MNFHDFVGLVGVSIIVISYFLLQIHKLDANDVKFSGFNIIGSLLILYSLSHDWNLPSVVIEIFWILISLIGVYRYIKSKRHN